MRHPELVSGSQCRFAFTLAEVLITLGIIGIVAAMTMPSLIASHREKATVSKLKKVYSTLSNSYLLVLNENGAPRDWNLPPISDPDGHLAFFEKFSPYLNLVKNCGISESGCYTDKLYTIQGTQTASDTLINPTAKAVLFDGTAIALRLWNNNCNLDNDICGFVEVDINGLKKPNQYGKDVFRFYITPKTIIPYGSQVWGGTQSFQSGCIDTIAFGYACTAWVIFNENMDYLHCPDKLGWEQEKSKSCKD